MTPTPEELIALNPRLGVRPRSEIEELVSAIEQSGWEWDTSRKGFFHPTLGSGVRTQGLDLFTAEKFLKHHAEMMREVQQNPEVYARYASGQRLWQKFGCLSIAAFLLCLGLGWLVLSPRVWLFSVVALALLVFGLYRYARKGVEQRDK